MYSRENATISSMADRQEQNGPRTLHSTRNKVMNDFIVYSLVPNWSRSSEDAPTSRWLKHVSASPHFKVCGAIVIVHRASCIGGRAFQNWVSTAPRATEEPSSSRSITKWNRSKNNNKPSSSPQHIRILPFDSHFYYMQVRWLRSERWKFSVFVEETIE